MDDYARKIGLLGLGIAALTKEKAEGIVEELVAKGELSEEEGRTLAKDLLKKSETQRNALEKKIAQEVKKAAAKLNLATKDDIKRLEKKIEAAKKKKGR